MATWNNVRTSPNRSTILPSASGQAITLITNASGVALTVTPSRMYGMPYYINKDFISLSVKWNVTVAASSGKNAKVILYDLATDGTANGNLANTGNVLADSTGVKAGTITCAGKRGWYWFSFVSDGGPTVYTIPPNINAFTSLMGISVSNGNSAIHIYQDITYGSPPAIPTWSFDYTNSFYPILLEINAT